MPDLGDLTIEQQHALRPAAIACTASSTASSAPRPSSSSSPPATTSSPPTPDRHLPPAHGRTIRPPTPPRPRQGRRQDDDGLPTVLFLCVHNAGRSQMALGWFNHLAGDRAVAWSGAPSPARRSTPPPSLAMAEVGIDIAQEFPKPWTDEIVQAADVVITMGCGDACPLFPGKRYEDWELDDPAGQDVDAVRPIRDEIEQRVRGSARQPRRRRRLTPYRLLLRFNRAALGETGQSRPANVEWVVQGPEEPSRDERPRQRPPPPPITTIRGVGYRFEPRVVRRKTCGEWTLM